MWYLKNIMHIKIEKNNYTFADVCAAIVLFLLVALPSLKGVFFPFGVLNFLPFVLIICTFILNPCKEWDRSYFIAMFPFLLFYIVLLLMVFINIGTFPGIDELLKYFLLICYTFFAPLLCTKKSVRCFLTLIVFWGVFLSLLRLTGNITFRDGFHYLTLGLPIGVMILTAFSNLFYYTFTIKSLFSIIYIVLGYAALLTLFGRSPLLYTTLTIFLFFILKVIYSNSVLKATKYSMIIASAFGIAIYVALNFLPSFLVLRFQRLIGTDGQRSALEEPRMDAVYRPAIEAIIENPFGYGLGSSKSVIGYYPHNIFLEILISSGFIGFIVFAIIFILFLKSCIWIVKNYHKMNTNVLGLSIVTFFCFLFWNTSFDLPSAYSLLPFMCCTIVLRYSNMKKQFFME